MAAKKSGRLRKIASEFSVGIQTIQEFLAKKGYDIGTNPNAKITEEMYEILEGEFQSEKSVKEASEKLAKERKKEKLKSVSAETSEEEEEEEEEIAEEIESDKEDVQAAIEEVSEKSSEIESKKDSQKTEDTHIKIETNKPKVFGKIDLEKKSKVSSKKEDETKSEQVSETKQEAEQAKVEKVAEEKVQEKTEKKSDSEIEDKTPEIKPEPKEEKAAEKTVTEDTKTEAETQTPSEKKDEKVVEQESSSDNKTEDAKDEQENQQSDNRLKKLKVLGKIDLPEKRPFKKSYKKDKQNKEDQKAETQEKKTEKTQANKDQKAKSEKENIDKKPEAEKTSEDKKPKNIEDDENFIKTKYSKLTGPKVVGKIELPKKKVASSADDPKKEFHKRKKKRRRIKKEVDNTNKAKRPQDQKPSPKPTNKPHARPKKKDKRAEPSEEDIQKKMKETLARLEGKKSTSVKHRKNKRRKVEDKHQQDNRGAEKAKSTLKVTEFVSANELANMIGVDVNDIIKTCMSLGLFVSINQRLDAETISVVADEYNYEVEFVSADVIEEISGSQAEDKEEDYIERSPIVTVMGHVDHGKTSLLDYIRKTNVIAGEAGGITQHIGAYEVEYEEGKTITFLDTPGHEAFTAMRARGSKITDIAIIVIAADDNIMPQTKEAINHAQAAGVPIVFAINKIDRPGANPEKIKEELANMNLLVEDWGGKYQSQDISALKGLNVDKLLEKLLLESELLELKGNPVIPATGVVLEASLDKGKGYVAKLLVRNGSLKIGDTVLAGTTYGRVKAMFNERNHKIDKIGPSQPALVLGLHSAPQAGDTFNVILDEKEAKTIANKREQLQREQGVRTQKHITLDEIGRRLAVGDFKELNIIVKGDVDGSVEALSDALIKLSTKEIQVNVIHKSVGQVNEADVMLAAASDAIIVAFQVRPSLQARKLAETEQIDIRNYSIIYKAIEEVKDAMEGMLSPDIEEKIVCTLEVRDVFKISKVGTIAGCYVLDGKITRNTDVRIIRDGIIIFTGKLGSLKRFKDDVREVNKGYECGLNIENFNDIKVEDQIEGFENVEVKRKL